MLKGTTTTGFKFELSENRLNNFELVETLAEVDENPLLLPKVVVMLLGKEQSDRLKNHLRDEEGLVSTDAMTKEVMEIFASQKETKN